LAWKLVSVFSIAFRSKWLNGPDDGIVQILVVPIITPSVGKRIYEAHAEAMMKCCKIVNPLGRAAVSDL